MNPVLLMNREYPSYAIASVGALLIDNDRILLIKRRYPPGQGKWAVPGGVIEPGETILDAARRELEEETGLRAKPLGVAAIVETIVLDSEKRVRYHYVIIDVLFDPRTVVGTPRPGTDAEDVAWMRIDDALNRSDVSRTTKELLKALKTRGSYLDLVSLVLNPVTVITIR